MNIVFLGTPEIAKVCLEKIFASKHKVLAVVTNLDKPTGRGQHLAKSPVKIFAEQNGIKLLQFQSVSKEGVETIKALKPDALVLVAFGQILSPEILNIALPINLHGSLLPLLRGPSPIQTAILNGQQTTGVSVMKMAESVDSGDILLQKSVEILPTDNSSTLFAKMAVVGGEAIVEALDIIEAGNAVWKKQDHKKATFCKMLKKEDAKLNFGCPAQEIVNKVRAFNPNPVAFFELEGQKIKVFSAKVVSLNLPEKFLPGQIASWNAKNGIVIKAEDEFVEILELQAPNKGKMQAKSFANGKKVAPKTEVA